MCNMCSKTYGRKDVLHRHQQYECGKEPSFVCPYCPKRAHQKFNIILHIKSMHPSEVSNQQIKKTNGLLNKSAC